MKPEDITRLGELGVASGREGLIDAPWIQVLANSCVAGPARTALCGQDDNLMVHAVIEYIQPGEVLVLSMPESTPVALIGELLATQVKVKQAAGILVDAAVRDVNELIELGLPIWTRFIRVKGADKKKIGELNASVVVGGTTITTGDILILDTDGAVCVKRERADQVLKASEARLLKETNLRSRLLAGETSYDLHGLRAYVEGDRK
jgi:4-hydroxy-4-methyl-2-oxoglutarate aldolase